MYYAVVWQLCYHTTVYREILHNKLENAHFVANLWNFVFLLHSILINIITFLHPPLLHSMNTQTVNVRMEYGIYHSFDACREDRCSQFLPLPLLTHLPEPYLEGFYGESTVGRLLCRNLLAESLPPSGQPLGQSGSHD